MPSRSLGLTTSYAEAMALLENSYFSEEKTDHHIHAVGGERFQEFEIKEINEVKLISNTITLEAGPFPFRERPLFCLTC